MEGQLNKALERTGEEDSTMVKEIVLGGGELWPGVPLAIRGASNNDKPLFGDLQRIGWSGLAMDIKGTMAKSMAITKLVYGTELVPLSGIDKETVRRQKCHGSFGKREHG